MIWNISTELGFTPNLNTVCKRGTYRKKDWLKSTARTVDHRAKEWGAQLKRCEADLDDGWWIF